MPCACTMVVSKCLRQYSTNYVKTSAPVAGSVSCTKVSHEKQCWAWATIWKMSQATRKGSLTLLKNTLSMSNAVKYAKPHRAKTHVKIARLCRTCWKTTRAWTVTPSMHSANLQNESNNAQGFAKLRTTTLNMHNAGLARCFKQCTRYC